MRFKGGTRDEMGVVERTFARVYDRLRKRAFRKGNRFLASVYDVYYSEGYMDATRDALDEVAELLEREQITELAELRGAGV